MAVSCRHLLAVLLQRPQSCLHHALSPALLQRYGCSGCASADQDSLHPLHQPGQSQTLQQPAPEQWKQPRMTAAPVGTEHCLQIGGETWGNRAALLLVLALLLALLLVLALALLGSLCCVQACLVLLLQWPVRGGQGRLLAQWQELQ